ncbi:MAG: zf-HC2 domain-containing protein, partial [Sorangiineae bacterium]|nr:zf-HC2 domain-containing protein [Sorangiineae bacterium]
VKSRLHRARVALRAKLAQEPAPPPGAAGACPDAAESFSRHLEGEIGTEECRAMEEHLARCAHCRTACESLRHTLELCRASRVGVVPSPIQDKIRRALGALTGPDPRASR